VCCSTFQHVAACCSVLQCVHWISTWFKTARHGWLLSLPPSPPLFFLTHSPFLRVSLLLSCSLSLYLLLSLSHSLPLFLFFSSSLARFLFILLSLPFHLSLSLSLFFDVCLYLSHLSIYLRASVCRDRSSSNIASLSLFPSFSFSLSLSFSLSVFLSFSLSLSLSHSLSVARSLARSSPSCSLSRSLSLSQQIPACECVWRKNHLAAKPVASTHIVCIHSRYQRCLVYVYIYICIRMCVCVCVCIYMCVFEYICAHTHWCMYICTHRLHPFALSEVPDVCIYVHTHIHMYTYIYIYMYMYILCRYIQVRILSKTCTRCSFEKVSCSCGWTWPVKRCGPIAICEEGHCDGKMRWDPVR